MKSLNFASDYILYKNISLDWTQVCQDLLTYRHDTDYEYSLLDNKDYGESLGKEQLAHSQFGYTVHNTRIWKTTNREPKITFFWEQQIIDQLPLDHAVATVTRQGCGQVLPWHQDRFYMLRRLHPDDNRPIWRFLVFLEDWKKGHFLQAEDSVIHHWKQGDCIVWQPDTWHLSGNIGCEIKWTCNITGFLKS
jgi:hypothetical protein